MRKKIISILLGGVVVVWVGLMGYLGVRMVRFGKSTEENTQILRGIVNTVSPTPRPALVTSRADLLPTLFTFKDPATMSQRVPEGEVKMLATGDIILGRSVNATMEKTRDFQYPFAKIAGDLKTGDIVFVNLESPLISGCQPVWEGMRFCGNPKGIAGLDLAGVTIANIANNHMGDYGPEGVRATAELLKQNHIAVTGDGEAPIMEVKGIKFGFLGYNDVPAGGMQGLEAANLEDMRKEIGELRKKVDVLVVAMHWGIEYRADPVDRQGELAHAAIDAGADLVIGNHPHWVEAVEVYKDKLITYAHGNFVFDQTWSRETQEGVVGRYVFDGRILTEVNFYPIIVGADYQPRWATPAEAEPILERMRAASQKLIQ